MPKDKFERELKNGDVVLIDAIVEEIFSDEDDPHVRVRLTGGTQQSLVLHGAALAALVEGEPSAATTDGRQPPDIEAATVAAYNGYGEFVDWTTFKGDKMPKFDKATKKIQDAWRAAVTRSLATVFPELAAKPAEQTAS